MDISADLVEVGDELIIDGDDWVVIDKAARFGEVTLICNRLGPLKVMSRKFKHDERIGLLRTNAQKIESRAGYRSIMGDAEDVRRVNAYEKGQGL